ncbi:MAG TPA: xanthine dehydrogenase family protein subunit M [Pseudolabrys sp.]|nr:xanthine dehydrogenase family protein subunit M [Pseudolabrys sp.]
MKPASFIYHRPGTLPEALALLSEHQGAARVLAGGQSLMPLMAMRMARPERVIDINRLDELKGIRDTGDTLTIGALTRYNDVLRSPLIAAQLPLLADAIRHVAHHAIRNRGTIGGSLALADPSAETPATCLALGARIVIRSASDEREIAADDFFHGLMATALEEQELLVAVRIPKRSAAVPHAFIEFARRKGDFAQAGVMLAPAHDRVSEDRAVIFGVGATPRRSPALEAALGGQGLTASSAAALGDELSVCFADDETSSFKRPIVMTLAQRAFVRLRP